MATEEQAIQQYGAENLHIYTSGFTSMYSAVTQHRQQAKFKLITTGTEEKVIGLHGIGYGVDEMIQGFAVAIKMERPKQILMRPLPSILLDQKNLLPCAESGNNSHKCLALRIFPTLFQ